MFNTPRLLWRKKKEEIAEAYEKRSIWGSKKSVQRRDAIFKMIRYLEEAKMLSNQNKTFRSLILSSSTFSLFYDLLPEQLQEDVSISNMSNDGSIDEDFDGLIKVLWLNLRVTVDKLDRTGGKPKVSKKGVVL